MSYSDDALAVIRDGRYKGFASSLFLDQTSDPPRLYFSDVYRDDDTRYRMILSVNITGRSQGESVDVAVEGQDFGQDHHQIVLYDVRMMLCCQTYTIIIVRRVKQYYLSTYISSVVIFLCIKFRQVYLRVHGM